MIVRGVMDLAESNPVRRDRDAVLVTIADDVGGIEYENFNAAAATV